jgi:hypothetical protein
MEILCFKVMTNVVTLVGADRGSLFLTRKEGGQKLLVSKLFGMLTSSLCIREHSRSPHFSPFV